MQYFKFIIPKDKDGNPVKYSPGWHGTMNEAPHGKVTVVLYNDKEGYGIAQVDALLKPLPKEVTAIDKTTCDKYLAETVKEDGVYVGEADIASRPEWQPEKIVEEVKEVDIKEVIDA